MKHKADSWRALSLAPVFPMGLITVLLECKVAWAEATVLPPWGSTLLVQDRSYFPSGKPRTINTEVYLF